MTNHFNVKILINNLLFVEISTDEIDRLFGILLRNAVRANYNPDNVKIDITNEVADFFELYQLKDKMWSTCTIRAYNHLVEVLSK